MKIPRWAQLIAGLAIAGAGLWFFFRNVDLATLGHELAKGNPWIYAACMGLTMLTLWFRSVRWRLLLPTVEKTHKRGLYTNILIGFMVNNILPARIGEAVRILILWRKNGYSPALSIGSLILERAIDLMAFMTCFFVPVFVLWGTTKLFISAVIIAGCCAAGVAALVLYAFWPAGVKRIAAAVLVVVPGGWREKLRRMIDEVFLNLDWVFSPAKAAAVAVLSYCIIGCYIGMMWLLARQAGGLSVVKCAFVNSAAALGAAIPLSPGYVGTLHAVMLQGLVMCGMSIEPARAMTILYHALGFIPVTVAGLICFFGADLSFKEISRASESIEMSAGEAPGEDTDESA